MPRPALLSAMATFLLGVPTGSTAGDPVLPLLDLPGSGTDPERIDYAALPLLPGQHAVIHPAAPGPAAAGEERIDIHHLRLQLHNYLLRHDDKFWCIWSDGPRIEDHPTQEVRFATSADGFHWSASGPVTGTPEAPRAFISRGLWEREEELLALVASYRGKGAFGVNKDLQLQTFAWEAQTNGWRYRGVVYDDAINNFPPQRLPGGDWILTRRDSRFNVTVLIGGRTGLDRWEVFPVVRVGAVEGFRPDEPIFWSQPDGTLFALYRDNGGSRRLFHSTSADEGRSWGRPRMTNIPNATSKLFSLATSRGFRVLILNANPALARRELHLALSRDGRIFTRLARLDIPSPPPTEVAALERLARKFSAGIASLQYPHAIEHDGRLFIAFSRLKTQTEIFAVDLDAVERLLKEEG